MNAKGYYEELTGEEVTVATASRQPQLEAILSAPLPAFRGNIRSKTRKEWAVAVRRLFKDMGLTGISVTTPSYSMAQAIDINLPSLVLDETTHARLHDRIWKSGGHTTDCPDCKLRWDAHNRISTIILSAYPDLDNRSDLQSDHHDYCLSVN